jgi:two-component system, chemotaxis family, protein-glutamate methylesterase/glutaminase
VETLTRDIVVIGASAGGLEVLKAIVGALPTDFPATILVVVHISPDNDSNLSDILGRFGPLPARTARDHQQIRRGEILVAPPDRHLIVGSGYARLTRGPRENRARPAVDPLFRSAARTYGQRVLGIILSGALDDGTTGLVAIKHRGGLAIVQDPESAFSKGMPLSAINHVEVDHVLRPDEIGPMLNRLVREPLKEPAVADDDAEETQQPAEQDVIESAWDTSAAESVLKDLPLTCPACGGGLSESLQQGSTQFRCHLGHAYTADHLMVEQRDQLENALWSALRGLREHAALQRRMFVRAMDSGLQALAEQYAANARQSMSQAEVIRRALEADPSVDRVPGAQG